MSTEMADRIMGSFDIIERGLGASAAPRAFTFFGGEPLLASSRSIVEHIIRRQKAAGRCTFTAVTNGTELEAYEDLLSPDLLSSIQITIDRPPEQHDVRRIYEDRRGSFEKISNNLNMALEKGINVAIRVNVDRNNFDELPKLADVIVDRGWAKYRNLHVYLAPVHDYIGSGKAGTRAEFFNSWELGRMLKDLKLRHDASRIYADVDSAIVRNAREVFASGGASKHKTAYCGAHTSMYIFDAFGDIYACWDRTGDQRLKIGALQDDGSVQLNDLAGTWRSRTVASNPTCRQCRFALNCGGGCAILAEGSSGDMFSNYCDVYGKRFRVAVGEAYLQHVASGAHRDSDNDVLATLAESLK
jgi:uncharacterized protein